SDGGMAEYTVVPTSMLHKLPDSVSLELGALVEPMSVAYHAATLGDVRPGDTAMVFGAGPIGIGLWFALRGKGLDDVFVVEPSPTR
ncbi:dehydrogenase, partial [Mycobacterium sp. ITM-2017-0098]